MRSKRFLKFLPVVLWSSFSIAIYAAQFIPLIASSIKIGTAEEKSAKACAAMVGIGLGEIFGSLGNGWLHDKMGTKRFALYNIVILLIAFGLLIAYTAYDTYNLPFAGLMTFVWGF